MAVWQRIQHYCAQHNQHQPLLFDQILPALRQISSGSDGLTDWARAMVGIRIPPATMIEHLIDDIAQLGDAHTTLLFRDACRAWQSGKNDPCATAFIRAIREGGGKPGYLRKTGTADMNVVAPIWQCPIIAYGPGDSSLDHTAHEHVSIAEFGKGVDTLIVALPLLAQRLMHSHVSVVIA
jgi:LysW-gamma-L-lysine carboxypeptidase